MITRVSLDMRGLQLADHRFFVTVCDGYMQVIVRRQDRAHGARITGMIRIMPGPEGDVISVVGMMPLTRRPKAGI